MSRRSPTISPHRGGSTISATKKNVFIPHRGREIFDPAGIPENIEDKRLEVFFSPFYWTTIPLLSTILKNAGTSAAGAGRLLHLQKENKTMVQESNAKIHPTISMKNSKKQKFSSQNQVHVSIFKKEI